MSIFTHPLEIVALLAAAALFGGMVLFAIVVTPAVLRSLNAAPAQEFLRALFPPYYLYVIVAALAASIATIRHNPRLGLILAAIAVAAGLLRQIVMPRVNAARDAGLAGDEPAAARFRALHRASVIVNLVQLLLAGLVVVRLCP